MFNQGPGKKSSSSKEGLSVYGIFQRFASTPQGRNRLRQDFLRPSTNIDIVRERHDFISVLLRPENSNCLEKLTKNFKHIKNLRPVMINLRKGISTGSAKVTGFKTTVWATLLAVCNQPPISQVKFTYAVVSVRFLWNWYQRSPKGTFWHKRTRIEKQGKFIWYTIYYWYQYWGVKPGTTDIRWGAVVQGWENDPRNSECPSTNSRANTLNFLGRHW